MSQARPLAAALILAVAACHHQQSVVSNGCDSAIKVPDGFCATIVADTVGKARQIGVRSNGDILVARLSSRRDSGGVSIIRKDSVVRFGSGATHGLVLASDSTIYVSTVHEILRYRFAGLSLVPSKRVDTIVTGLPSGAIPSHTLALDAKGFLLVNISATGAGCAAKQPCPELATGAGIWRFDTGKRNQTMKDGSRIATGLRDALAIAVNPRDTAVYVVSEGPDSLHERFPKLDAYIAATRPAVELDRIASIRADYGWPYCYYDAMAATRVQSPEYGGDGTSVGNCDRLVRPLAIFPAHWEPMALVFPRGAKWPSKFADGALVAFHGSSNRAPLPEDGYLIAFVPFKGGVPSIEYSIFADGFAGQMKSPTGALHRVSGMTQAPDGSIYVSDDKGGRIWRVSARP